MDRRYGGYLIASFASLASGGALPVSAFDLFSSTYGITLASQILLGGSAGTNPQIGMKPIITAFLDYSGSDGTSPVWYGLSATQAMATDDSVIIVLVRKLSTTAAGSGGGQLVLTAASGSIHVIMQGWIVSTPFAYH